MEPEIYSSRRLLTTPPIEIERALPPSFTFASTPVGNTSSDSPQSVTVQNIGNADLTASAPGLFFTPGFNQVSGPGTPEDCTGSFSLAPGVNCNISIAFEPESATTFSGALTITDNALNANPAAQVVPLSGTGQANPPVVAGINPAQGPSSGGTAVTITGSGFTGATTVEFGASPAASFTVVTDTTITAITPAGTVGPVNVKVVTSAGISTTSPQFTYLPTYDTRSACSTLPRS
jgi:hypothetical protein